MLASSFDYKTLRLHLESWQRAMLDDSDRNCQARAPLRKFRTSFAETAGASALPSP